MGWGGVGWGGGGGGGAWGGSGIDYSLRSTNDIIKLPGGAVVRRASRFLLSEKLSKSKIVISPNGTSTDLEAIGGGREGKQALNHAFLDGRA